MKIMIVGNGKSGSWKIRGEQLGAAIGANVVPKAVALVNGVEVLIIVKRTLPWLGLARIAREKKVKVVLDVLDSWPRVGNDWSRKEAMNWLRDELNLVSPDVVVASTEQMSMDCSVVSPLPNFALHHHARPGQKINPIREKVATIGYEGGEQYLGLWRDWIESECEHRGWRFIVNPESLSDVDIVVAVRNHLGYTTRNWKSNVKLANAQATGTPCILNRETGYIETASGGEVWADDRAEMRKAFDELSDQTKRKKKSELLKQAGAKVSVDSIASVYKESLRCALNS